MIPDSMSDEFVYSAVLDGELEIDQEGRVWRVAFRQWDRWREEVRTVQCARRRAERFCGGYLQVRAMYEHQRKTAQAHRLVWRHFNGVVIPAGLTINHKNGDKLDNRPGNLELATYAEQTAHCLTVLGVRRDGEFNARSVLTDAAVRDIRQRRRAGERLTTIAEDYDVCPQTISKVALGKSWAQVTP